MAFQDLPIRRKVTAVIMLTSIIALLLTTAAFMVYDGISYRQEMVHQLSITSSIIAENSSGVLAFPSEPEAEAILARVRADKHIVAAALYGEKGDLFVRYPTNLPVSAFPVRPGKLGHQFEDGHLVFFQPVIQIDRVGTAYLKSDLKALSQRLRRYATIALLVLLGSVLVALVISNALQRHITAPIFALTNVATVVSEQRDYSVRAPKTSRDELGLLTGAFNQMLTRIQEQTVALRESEDRLRLALEASRTGAWHWDLKSNEMTWNRPFDEKPHAPFGPKAGVFGAAFEDFMKLIDPQDRAGLTEAIQQALEQKTTLNREFRVIWPDGSVHFLAGRGKGFYDPAGKPLRLTGVILDITERKQAEDRAHQLRRALEVSERQRAVERERARIARDIHDDLGASLTRISLLSETVRDEISGQAQVLADVDQIYSTAHEVTRAMDEIVWAVNPTHDTLDSLVAYLGRYAERYLSAGAIRCRLDVPLQLPPWVLDAEVRHNVFLAFKEALNNIVKHAQATEVRISVEVSTTGFALLVMDNGCGFSWNAGESPRLASSNALRCAGGNGLVNMRKRMEGIGGDCTWETAPGEGTRIKLEVLNAAKGKS